MRLRKLKYPIAIFEPNGLMGGRDAGLASSRRWNANLTDYYLKGGFNNFKFIDCTGHEFEIRKIYFGRVDFLTKIIDLVTTVQGSEKANIDMELVATREYSLDEFCSKFRQLALENPEWWKRYSEREEIERMFGGCETFKDAINDIGVLDPPGREKLSGKSTVEIVDLRNP